MPGASTLNTPAPEDHAEATETIGYYMEEGLLIPLAKAGVDPEDTKKVLQQLENLLNGVIEAGARMGQKGEYHSPLHKPTFTHGLKTVAEALHAKAWEANYYARNYSN